LNRDCHAMRRDRPTLSRLRRSIRRASGIISPRHLSSAPRLLHLVLNMSGERDPSTPWSATNAAKFEGYDFAFVPILMTTDSCLAPLMILRIQLANPLPLHRKDYSKHFDPCQEAANKSIKCLHRNPANKDLCNDYFQAYRDCKKAWVRAFLPARWLRRSALG
jgi:hypothetical protein